MIQSFADETTVDLFRERNTRHARRIPRDLWRQAQRKLKALDVAARLQDLKVPAGNRLERLKFRLAIGWGGAPGSTVCESATSTALRFAGRVAMPTKSASKTITRDLNWVGPAVPPGEMLLEEFLKPLGLRQVDAAGQLGISVNRLNEIVLGKRGITADTALRLSRLLKTSPQFWMRLQADWDLHLAMERAAS